jgi:hypothetical protein
MPLGIGVTKSSAAEVEIRQNGEFSFLHDSREVESGGDGDWGTMSNPSPMSL